ncbi:Sulfur oxidation protein SoxY [hydrothermal vent metagenome]|uniref:Sulfur oxidation protein SoxY n=1 Tax=hydrothermal vent metagenome TaxID=652676 RepID=A0A1W1CG39_9ZZZZ
MERRKFLGLGLAAAALVPASLSALDFRKEKPDTWTAKNVADAVKALYGDIKPVEGDLSVKTPKIASNGGAVPVTIKSGLELKTVAVFEDVNPEAAVAVFTIPEGTKKINYMIKIKMKKSGSITVIGEGKDGKFYKASRKLDVALGGCEG